MASTIVWLFAVSAAFIIVTAVNRPPKIIVVSPKDVFFKPGEAVELRCIAEGIPNPLYIWKRNDVEFNPSGQGDRVIQKPGQGSIIIHRTESKDEGTYQCFANNGYGVSVSLKMNLWEAKLGQFVAENRRIHRVFAGNSLTLPCWPPLSRPRAGIRWAVKKPNGQWKPIKFSKRISMDLEARLRFTNVELSDEQGGEAYACMALNPVMRTSSIGPEHTIQVFGTTPLKRPAYIYWASPSDILGLVGQTLNIKCIFAGNPTPDVYWKKQNGTLPRRANLKSYGQELEITNLQTSDAGQYECLGTSSETPQNVTKVFTLHVQSAPYWTEEPKDVVAGIGGKATFICQAAGTPPPIYKWFINGEPLDGPDAIKDPRIFNNSRFHRNNNNITLTDLTLEDHMNIQCNASNIHGYVFSDVYLNVMDTGSSSDLIG